MFQPFLPYNTFRYLFPPRPENALPVTLLEAYEKKGFVFQPKLNGDCCVVFMNGKDIFIYDRHKKIYTKPRITEDIAKLYRETIAEGLPTNKWMVLTGEYMVKSKFEKDGKLFNHKFVVHDIIAYDNFQLVGMTTTERIELLDKLYGTEDKEILEDGIRQWDYLYTTGVRNCYRVKSYSENIVGLWSEMFSSVDTDEQILKFMFEGFVAKSADSPLENGSKEMNNNTLMVKFRIATKNYSY